MHISPATHIGAIRKGEACALHHQRGATRDGKGQARGEARVSLRVLAETNLAEALLQVVIGETLPRLVWRSGVVHFDANGAVKWHP